MIRTIMYDSSETEKGAIMGQANAQDCSYGFPDNPPSEHQSSVLSITEPWGVTPPDPRIPISKSQDDVPHSSHVSFL